MSRAPTVEIQGLVPCLPPHRPRAAARWWSATGTWKRERLLVGLDEGASPAAVAGACGLAAPCSLPAPFLEHLGLGGARAAGLDALASRTRDRLFHEARAFAARREHGRKHPVRCPGERVPALDRRRLALFHAALPLLRSVPTIPWADPAPPFLFEVDPAAWLAAAGLPSTGLSGSRPPAVTARARILDALREGVLGFPVELAARDLAVASALALDAVLCAAAARWLIAHAPKPPAGVEAWIPVP